VLPLGSVRIDRFGGSLNTPGMRTQDIVPYTIGLGLAIGGLALYLWLTSVEDSGQSGPVGLPDVYNVL
jgi:hypothetical protein